MLEGFFYGQKKLPIILFSYIVPIRKDNKKMTRKHFRELARILGSNMALDDLVNDIANFCASQNSHFQKQLFIDAVEEHYQEAKKELEKVIS